MDLIVAEGLLALADDFGLPCGKSDMKTLLLFGCWLKVWWLNGHNYIGPVLAPITDSTEWLMSMTIVISEFKVIWLTLAKIFNAQCIYSMQCKKLLQEISQL